MVRFNTGVELHAVVEENDDGDFIAVETTDFGGGRPATAGGMSRVAAVLQLVDDGAIDDATYIEAVFCETVRAELVTEALTPGAT